MSDFAPFLLVWFLRRRKGVNYLIELPGDASVLRGSLAECVNGFAVNDLLLIDFVLPSFLDDNRGGDAAGLRAGAHGKAQSLQLIIRLSARYLVSVVRLLVRRRGRVVKWILLEVKVVGAEGLGVGVVVHAVEAQRHSSLVVMGMARPEEILQLRSCRQCNNTFIIIQINGSRD